MSNQGGPPPTNLPVRPILAINGGSSSLKFAVFGTGDGSPAGEVERIGRPDAALVATVDGHRATRFLPDADRDAALAAALDWIGGVVDLGGLGGVGHRVVHGGPDHAEPCRMTPDLLAELRRIVAFDPIHLPVQIALIEAVAARLPGLPQVACFDTAFHAAMPRVARLLPIPRRFEAEGVRRYGFHGLSYAFLMEELARIDSEAAARGRVILAHLGSGASLAAVRDGACVDTTMGFTPDAGLPMATRSGDLDPGLACYLMESGGLSVAQFRDLVECQSGLLGVSGTSGDVRDLLRRAPDDPRAAEAVDLFCYQIRKQIGAYAGALGGLDVLVFSGGIGEHSAEIRARSCEGLGFLGVELDPARNDAGAPRISTDSGRVAVRAIPTDEARMLARSTARILGLSTANPAP